MSREHKSTLPPSGLQFNEFCYGLFILLLFVLVISYNIFSPMYSRRLKTLFSLDLFTDALYREYIGMSKYGKNNNVGITQKVLLLLLIA